ncbi:MAG: hypothetical protein RLZZ511_3069 [Cyanobacteriota bacterium]
MIETYQPDHSPKPVAARLQAEIDRQQQFDTSPAAPLELRMSTRQTQIAHIGLILDAATQKAQPRHTLPGKLTHLPILNHPKIQRGLTKIYNFLFKEQRTAQMATIQAVRESAKLHQQMVEQTQALEEFQRGLQHSMTQVEQRLTRLETRLGQTEAHLQQTTLELRQLQIPDSSVNLLYQISDRIQRLEAAVHQLEHRLEQEYRQRLQFLSTDLSHQKHVLHQMKQRFALEASPLVPEIPPPTVALSQDSTVFDGFYTAFEETFRGSRALILERLERYLPLIQELNLRPQAPIIDLGCGRGEWLELLQREGYRPIGIDLNPTTLKECQDYQLSVVQADILQYLQSLPDHSVVAVTGFHVVEHLPFEVLGQLISEAFRVVEPGGFVLFETPNPRNLMVSGFSFYFDPTHRNPIPAEVMQFLLRYNGFDQVVPIWVNPSDLPKVPEDSELGRRFNELFYGFMDYAVMGLKG